MNKSPFLPKPYQPKYTYYGIKLGEKVIPFPKDRLGVQFAGDYVMAKDQHGHWFMIMNGSPSRISCEHFNQFVEEGLWAELKEVAKGII